MLSLAPYSPDMCLPDFDVLLELEEPMRGRRFCSLEELYIDVIRSLRHMNKSGVLDGIIMLPKC